MFENAEATLWVMLGYAFLLGGAVAMTHIRKK